MKRIKILLIIVIAIVGAFLIYNHFEKKNKDTEVIDKFIKEYTLLDLTLVTGRTHQIRAHMSYIRHHVVGDTKYGDFKANNYFKKEFGFENQFLHARELHFGKLAKPLDYLSSKSFKAEMPEEYNKIIDKLKEEK